MGLEPDTWAFCGWRSRSMTNWQCDLGHVPSEPQPPCRHCLPPSPRAEPVGAMVQGYHPVSPAPHAPCCCSALRVPRPAVVHASAPEWGHLASNGPGEQVCPACCNDYWVNTVKRTQAHGPKGGNNLSEWPGCYPTPQQRKNKTTPDPLCPLVAGQQLPGPALARRGAPGGKSISG